MSTFPEFRKVAWPWRYAATIHVEHLRGGTPSDPKVAEGWIKSKLGVSTERLVQQQVAQVMAERRVDEIAAAAEVDVTRHLNGFKRDDQGLYIEGRQLKAAIKEAACCAAAVGKLPLKSWGQTRKGLLGFLAEHVCVVQTRLHLGRSEPTGVDQRFVHTFRGTGIQMEEYCDDVDIDFTIMTDFEFTEAQWAAIWLSGEQQGIGATRSQGHGRYELTRWEATSR